MNKPLIIWEKWQDPFGEKNDDIISYDQQDSVSQYEEDEQLADKVINETTSRVLLTPMGIIPYNDNTASCKIFNFWLGHTNFSISKTIAEIIENVDGVETLDIFTRYRFRIAVGKVFDDREIMRNINTASYNFINNL
jgi:hypothetical protein